MHHSKAGRGCAEVWDALPAERTDVRGLEIGATKGDAGHPGGDAAAGGEEDVFGDGSGEELPLERVDFCGFAFVEQDTEIALRREDEELVGVDAGAPEVADAVEGDAVGPCALA